MSPKRIMWTSVAVFLVLCAITSYIEVLAGGRWWVKVGGASVRAIPMYTFLVGYVRLLYLRGRPQRPHESSDGCTDREADPEVIHELNPTDDAQDVT